MNKNIFWIISVFLISLNIVLLTNTQNYLLIGIVLILSTLYIGFKFKKLFLENNKYQENQHQENMLGHDKVDAVIIAMGLFLFVLSIIFYEYEMELLLTASLLAITQTIRTSWIKKKRNS